MWFGGFIFHLQRTLWVHLPWTGFDTEVVLDLLCYTTQGGVRIAHGPLILHYLGAYIFWFFQHIMLLTWLRSQTLPKYAKRFWEIHGPRRNASQDIFEMFVTSMCLWSCAWCIAVFIEYNSWVLVLVVRGSHGHFWWIPNCEASWPPYLKLTSGGLASRRPRLLFFFLRTKFFFFFLEFSTQPFDHIYIMDVSSALEAHQNKL